MFAAAVLAAAKRVSLAYPSTRGDHLYLPANHLTGLRGIFTIQSLLWVFFSTFIPALAWDNAEGPTYQRVIHAVFAAPLWNESLVSSAFVLLSMRTIPVTFLRSPSPDAYAGSIIRRIFRTVILFSVASGIATGIFSKTGTRYIDDFKEALPNPHIQTPTVVPSGVAAFNSLFNLFMITREFSTQAANSFWPSATLWVSSVLYSQGFTVYILMVILPHTRVQWHIQGLGLFALGSFWMASWGWYSATGLILADLACSEEAKHALKRGIPMLRNFRLPVWILGLTMFVVGMAFKYTFAILPQYRHSLLFLHPFLDLSESDAASKLAREQPTARLDDWLVLVGLLLTVETSDVLRELLSHRVLAWIGSRSFSLFAAQCIIFWTAGIKLWMVLHDDHAFGPAMANALVFVSCLPATFVFAEVYLRVVDWPSAMFARFVFTWLLN